MNTPSPEPTQANGTAALIRWHGFAAVVCVLYVALLGLIMAIKLHSPEWLSEASWLTWGRIRYAHTQGVFFGWLGNAFLAFLYYAVPRLADRPVTSVGLGWALFGVWNFLLVLPGWALVQAGVSQPLEWAEFPLQVDAAAVLGFLLTCVQFVGPLLRARVPSLYVSAWYILGGLTFTLLAYPVGNFVPEVLGGAQGATFSGLWIHDAVGLYVTPMALAVAYAVIPVVTRRPIFSHFLSMIGFWLLFLIYPLNGTHHYVFSSIPMDAQKGAIVASIYLGMTVILVVTNLLLSLRGQSAIVASDVPLRFVWFGTVVYLIVSLQGSMQAIMPVNRLVHFTDWVIGHSHLAMIGFASFTALGGLFHAWRYTPGCRYNACAANWAFWLLALGLIGMVVDLTAAGLVQGLIWQTQTPWIDSVSASKGFWVVRSISGLVILTGFIAVVLSLTTGPRTAAVPTAEAAPVNADEAASDDEPRGVRWLKGGYTITAGAGLGLFVFSFVVLAIWPNQTLTSQIAQSQPGERFRRTESEERGRQIYAREGCITCHSQLVRATEDDVRRFGAASQAWEADADAPQMWGTRRIGPDLAREGGRKSRDWQQTHLWNPRWIVAESVMPDYPWLFDGDPTRPTDEGTDLVNYLESLGREAKLAGLLGPSPLSGVDRDEEAGRGMFCDCGIPRSPGAAPVWFIPEAQGERERFARHGAAVFGRHCAGCHGSNGGGNGPAATALTPVPRNLTTVRLADRQLADVLWNGKPGSSMPAWNDLPTADLRGLAAYLQSLPPQQPAPQLSPDDLDRAKKLFGTQCAVCHGAGGAGDGVSAARLAPRPTNFHKVQPSQIYAETALERGIRGTAMPKWGDKLNAGERRLLASYLRTLYSPRE